MRSIPLILVVASLAAVVLVDTSAAGAVSASSTHPKKPRTCGSLARQFRERLEPVVEASIDKRPQRAGPAAERARSWWTTHADQFWERATTREGQPAADSLLTLMVAAGGGNQPLEAARIAVVLASTSLNWCDGSPPLADQLMRIDLAGMAAWLRAQGVEAAWPPGIEDAAAAVKAKLIEKGNEDLAHRIELGLTAAMQISVRASGDASAADQLLNLVDDAEKEVR